MIGGVAVGCGVIIPLLVPVYLRAFGRDRYVERWGRYEYRITRDDSFVFAGTSYRKENPDALDDVANRILLEWFDDVKGALGDGENYHCIAFLKGYGVGEAWG